MAKNGTIQCTLRLPLRIKRLTENQKKIVLPSRFLICGFEGRPPIVTECTLLPRLSFHSLFIVKIKTINLLVDAHGFDDHFQGSRTYISGLYRSLISQAPWIHFFFAAYDVHTLQQEFGSHQNVSYLKFKGKNNLFRLSIDVPRLVRQNKIDIAHFQYVVPFVKKCKEIVTIHDVLFMDYPQYFPFLYKVIRRPIFRYSARKADTLLTVSDYAKHSISKNLKVPEDKVIVLPNGIDKSFLHSQPSSAAVDYPYILYVSRWEPRKNHLL